MLYLRPTDCPTACSTPRFENWIENREKLDGQRGGREGASGDDPGFALPLRVSSPSITTSDTIRIASLLSQGRGGRDGVSYNYKSQRRRERERERELHSSLSDVPHCPPQRLSPPSSSNNSLLSTALFLSTAFEQWPWMRRGSRGKIVIRFFLLRCLLLLFPLCYCNSELLIFCDVLIVRFSWKI